MLIKIWGTMVAVALARAGAAVAVVPVMAGRCWVKEKRMSDCKEELKIK